MSVGARGGTSQTASQRLRDVHPGPTWRSHAMTTERLPFDLELSSGASPPRHFIRASAADRILATAGVAWWVVALAGQTIFTAYIASLYGVSAWSGHFDRWNEVVPRGWVPGHGAGNLTLAGHLLFAALVFASGGLQLVGAVRRRA